MVATWGYEFIIRLLSVNDYLLLCKDTYMPFLLKPTNVEN